MEMTEKELDESLKNSLNLIENLIEKWCEENKSPTLYKIIHDELGYSHDCTAEIIDAVEKWLPKEDPRPSYATMQWDKCVRMMKEKLE
jgi:hypothetical protein